MNKISIKMNRNGQKVVSITAFGKSFSVQTNQNIPTAHSISCSNLIKQGEWDKIKDELILYVLELGTDRQKKIMADYLGYSS